MYQATVSGSKKGLLHPTSEFDAGRFERDI